MAIYIDDIGQGELPLQINNPQEGESLIWSEELGAYVNAPGGGGPSTEQIQDTVADMLEVDPDGTQVALRLTSSYDDVTGKITFNVVSDSGSSSGSGSNIIIKEAGTTRGVATTLDFIGPAISFSQGVATISGMMDNIGISNAGTGIGNVHNFNFEGFELLLDGDTVTVVAPPSGNDYTLPTASGSTLGGIKLGTGLSIDGNGIVSVTGGGSDYTLPTASTSVLGGVKVDGTTITISNGVITSVGGGTGGGISIGDVSSYLTTNGYTTTTYVDNQISNLVDGAPNLLNTLNELAAALADNPNFATDVLLKSGGTMTGALTLSGAPTLDLQAATKKYVDDSISAIPAPTTNLDALTDVNLTGATAGQILGWNGTTWVPVANSGAKGDTGAAGPAGAAGTAGLSISAATVTLLGRLQLTLTDNSVVDAGNVSGIKSATINGSGNLILTKQDNTTVDAGYVIGPTGATGAQGLKGDTGATGPAGATISSAVVNGSGNLIFTKSDSSTIDAGSIVGPKGDQGVAGNTGAQGPKGDTGVGIAIATVDGAGNLQITLDDATPINAGYVRGDQGPQGVQGPAGRSIADSGVVIDSGGNLQVTLTDGVTINAGYAVGPQGSTGPTGAKGDTGDQGVKGDTGATGTSWTLNGITNNVAVYGLGATTQPGYNFEVDLSNKANKLTTARTIGLTGKVTGLGSFDGSQNLTITTALNGVSTNDVSEGTNLYFTQARARSSLSSTADGSISSLISYDDSTGVIKYRASTSYITEGSNLYFTNSRADTRADLRIGASSINALADVDTVTSTPTNNQVLTWTGTAWTPANPQGAAGSVSSVNTKTGAVVLGSDDVTEGTSNLYFTNSRWDTRLASKSTDNLNEGTTNKYFSNTLARNAMAAGTGLSYNSSTGTFSLSANSDQVSEGSSNLFYTNARFDSRLGQSNLTALADVADTTPTTGQALAWNGSAWAPTTISGGGSGGTGGGTGGVFRATVQVDYDPSGNLTAATVLSGGISAVIATATSTVATVTFTFTGSVCAPLGIQIYGYQKASNVYVTRAVSSDYTTRTIAGGGSSGSPSAFSAFDPSVNTLTLSLTKTLTGATAAVGQTTSCVVQFLLSTV